MRIYKITEWNVSKHGGAAMKDDRYLLLALDGDNHPQSKSCRQCVLGEKSCDRRCNCGYTENHIELIADTPTPQYNSLWDLWAFTWELPEVHPYLEDIKNTLEHYHDVGNKIHLSCN